MHSLRATDFPASTMPPRLFAVLAHGWLPSPRQCKTLARAVLVGFLSRAGVLMPPVSFFCQRRYRKVPE